MGVEMILRSVGGGGWRREEMVEGPLEDGTKGAADAESLLAAAEVDAVRRGAASGGAEACASAELLEGEARPSMTSAFERPARLTSTSRRDCRC